MKSYIRQYELFFLLLWSLYLVYPVWALPVSVFERFLIYTVLISYFACLAYIMHRWFNDFPLNNPFIISAQRAAEHIKSNIGFFAACFIAIILHLFYISSPIFNLGDEALHIQGGLWAYDFLGREWHKFLQIIFWGVIGVIVISKMLGLSESIFNVFNSIYQRVNSNLKAKLLFFLILFSFLVGYFLLLKGISYHLSLVRYPPVSRMLYFFTYLIFGITHLGPRAIQLVLCLISAHYIYRTINLFSEKEASLLGASIFLFSPPIFHYAHNAQLTSGVVFFVVAISFYFLRYLKEESNRDLALTSFFIGAGFLYKEDILLMFFICTSYLLFIRLIKKNKHIKTELKILLISLIPIIPWMVMQKFVNWRSYSIHWKHLVSVDIILIYFRLILSQVSWILVVLFLAAVIYIIYKKRSDLSMYYACLFLGFYVFYTADYTAVYIQHRFTTIFYPTIAVFISLFIYHIAKKIKWRHSFTAGYLALSFYLIVLSVNPSMGTLIYGNQHLKFPSQEAAIWVKNNIKDGEKILSLRIFPMLFYRDKYDIDPDKIINLWYELDDVETPAKLKEFSIRNNIKYIMFPYDPNYSTESNRKILEYLKRNDGAEFMEVERFHINENFIYIYKIKA